MEEEGRVDRGDVLSEGVQRPEGRKIGRLGGG